MSDSATAAKKAFGIRLKEIRLDASLTGNDLAARSGMRNSKISRIEHGRQNPTEDDIRAWCTACGVPERIPELIARHREIEQMWVEYRDEIRAGQVHIQSRSTPLYEGTRLLRAYEANLVPGILQTRAYFVAALTTSALLRGTPVADIEAAADARLARQHLVTAGTGLNNYSFVIEHGVLEHAFGDDAVMIGQMEFLIRATRLPNVALGVIPPWRRRIVRAGEGFYLFDEQLVRSEMWSGGFRTRRTEEVAFFVKLFGRLRDMAVYGDDARALITAARSQYAQTRENS
ncbi:helix-turn-helix transcriptional regulator [Actinocorallia sp. A-T 12471]|uniref:helix-turn-helix domain-containing protein n=1 Tax=Actinocorallia sp. A-T 12471 TaxID=3089813 RepID=UPI0029D1B19F|nr:helix-turn-helix transcriptional regulator [Actinocorallia sp. A-T 12471]MDX6740492.1 helix-turn-helix transcriptional regulator [Actinocorallia sp. A-T 12471]